MNMTRRHAAALIGSALLLPQCSSKGSGDVIRVGSKDFTEEFILAELYAQSLEAAGMKVERKFNLGGSQIAMAALQRGDIDLYPEYTGTGLIDILHQAPIRNADSLYATVKQQFNAKYNLTWLAPSPMNDSQGLATTHEISSKYNLTTLSQLSKLAPELRLGAIAEFVVRADALPGLQKFYGGFKFKDVKTYAIGLKYQALLQGSADVVTAFTTDAQILANKLVVLADDRHFWPEYHPAPVVRNDVLKKFPAIAKTLDALAPRITTDAIRLLNMHVDVEHQEPADVAKAFLSK
jgi:osmoprotectant transport system substrate-binding protein